MTPQQQRTYGFKYKGDHQDRIASIHAIGHEYRQDEDYKWHGLKRHEESKVVFQYTLSGQGMIEIDGSTHSLTEGQAFLVELPSDHVYYLSNDATHWEFIFITLYGNEAFNFFNNYTKAHGHFIKLNRQARPIQQLFYLLDKIETNQVTSSYQLAADAFTFLMNLSHDLEHPETPNKDLPVAIAKSIAYIKQHFQTDISLPDIVHASGLSTYHFSRLFQREMKDSPIKYVTKMRINHALNLLQDPNFSIEEVARQVGYEDANYFTKVFKQYVELTPSDYRHNKSIMPVNQIFFN
ncbi:AraC-like ligand binding domain-containing protein [Pelagirhabdus alkalitolerans]|uniref:AraC-like ligand binding domain-containing protein n=1 Tax=Pelagirhabdus alkalitolerans TaxID=1612202 RepID=A0A1G6IQ60_9BACI|nr:AraC family transcriptional regulator [Pelagirhabdus alkalitolerans]SDC08580.1 AraC-like ligand binding domain-containing protein [Pelagirhabdus alkalitolerans]